MVKMNHEKNARYDEYLDILAESDRYKHAFDKTCKAFADKNGKPMQLDNRLYLMVFAPTLIGYVNWVIYQAVQTGKDRLYFLSRDGYQMYLIAKRLVAIQDITIECRYLHVSRFSMRMPGYHFDVDKSIDSICVGGIDITPWKIIQRGGLTEEECHEVIGELHMEADRDTILNYHQVMQLREKLRTSKLLKMYINKHSLEAYDSAIGYLKQEGLCKDGRFAIVDSGWVGTLQCSIEMLIQSVNPDIKVEGYYFGMYEYPKGASCEQFHTYYFSAEKGIRRKACFSNSLFETIVSADEGMTLGYEQKESIYIPIQDQRNNPNGEQMRRNVEVLKLYLQQLESEDGSDVSEQLLTKFMSKPTMLEYECYGQNLFSDDVLDGCYKEVAAKLTMEQIRNQRFINKLMIICGIKKATIYESAWLEGSAVRAVCDSSLDIEKKKKILSSELKHIRMYKRFVFLRKQMKRK